MSASRWLPFGGRSDADVRLLCLPHAGSGASTFKAWGRGLSPQIAVCPVQPPGREGRRTERTFTAVGPLVRELAAEVATTVAGPYALFGHSTGALCAFEVARELRATGGPAPVHLFVSGRRAPQLPMEHVDVGASTPAELELLLRRMGGTPEEILGDHDFLQALQPLLAADFAVNQNYDHEPGAPLDLPLTAFAGKEDPVADAEAMTPWKEQTTGEFTLYELDGGHFAVFGHRAQVHEHMAAHLAPFVTERGYGC